VRRSHYFFSSILIYCLVAIFLIIVFFPIYWMMKTSFIQKSDLFVWPPTFIPVPATLTSYINAFVTQPLLRWINNTLFISLATMGIIVWVGCMAGYSLSRFRYPGRMSFIMMILATQMIPGVLLVIPLFVIFNEIGLIDTLYALIIGDTAYMLPISIWIIKSQFDSIPVQIEEAAIVDGCGHWGVLFHILLPLAAPAIAAAGAISFSLAWGEFLLARTVISSEENWVLSIVLSSYRSFFGLKWGQLMATASIMVMPPLILLLILQRYIIQGLTAGGVKQ